MIAICCRCLCNMPASPLTATRYSARSPRSKRPGRFQDVQLSVIPDIEGVRVLLILQPALYFGIYEFPGSKGFAYSRLLQVANYPPEGPYNQRDVTQASDALTKFFQQNGYFLAKVTPRHRAGCATWDCERTLSG